MEKQSSHPVKNNFNMKYVFAYCVGAWAHPFNGVFQSLGVGQITSLTRIFQTNRRYMVVGCPYS
jgi:hypothetical protein